VFPPFIGAGESAQKARTLTGRGIPKSRETNAQHFQRKRRAYSIKIAVQAKAWSSHVGFWPNADAETCLTIRPLSGVKRMCSGHARTQSGREQGRAAVC
jgi:hypothetical protein